MKVPIAEVADAVDSYFKGMSIPQIRENLFQQYNDHPSVASIFDWLTLLKDSGRRGE
jgi:hypothetical protein